MLLMSTQPMINGDLEEGFDATVVVMSPAGTSSSFVNCSGSMITPRVGLTAAHCIEAVGMSDFVDGFVHFGPAAFAPDAYVPIDAAYAHPSYVFDPDPRLDPDTWDLAVFTLSSDASVRPTPFRRTAVSSALSGTALKSVGYGVTAAGGGGIGERRSIDLELATVRGNVLVATSDIGAGEGHICTGDSGGPQFAMQGDAWVQWGVHSWSSSGCTGEQGSTRVDIAAPWILDRVEEVHGSRDVCTINGWRGDGPCDPGCTDPDPDCAGQTTTAPDDTGATADTADTQTPDPPADSDPATEDAGGGCACAASGPARLVAPITWLSRR